MNTEANSFAAKLHAMRTQTDRAPGRLPDGDALADLVRRAKARIEPHPDRDAYAKLPGVCLTVAWNPATGNWGFQTEEITYHGRFYGYTNRVSVSVFSDTNESRAANNILHQLEEP